jgi:hypothetical protein
MNQTMNQTMNKSIQMSDREVRKTNRRALAFKRPN